MTLQTSLRLTWNRPRSVKKYWSAGGRNLKEGYLGQHRVRNAIKIEGFMPQVPPGYFRVMLMNSIGVEPTSINLPQDPRYDFRYSLGFCIVRLPTDDAVWSACEKLNGVIYDELELSVSPVWLETHPFGSDQESTGVVELNYANRVEN